MERNIHEVHQEGPFQIGIRVSDVIFGGTEGAFNKVPVRLLESLNDPFSEEKESHLTDAKAQLGKREDDSGSSELTRMTGISVYTMNLNTSSNQGRSSFKDYYVSVGAAVPAVSNTISILLIHKTEHLYVTNFSMDSGSKTISDENNARGNGVAGNVGGQNRGGMINPGQAKIAIKCYNCNGLGHIARECPRPKRFKNQTTTSDTLLLMQSPGRIGASTG
ncbi:retrovirus-related pol polyprotein from transposon TNT 1-94 [Tanacetum coccineum]